jgi:hypothetical protein
MHGALGASGSSATASASSHDPHASGGSTGGLAGSLDPATSRASDPSSAVLGTADGAVQQAWSDGGSVPFQDARRPPRALVIAVLAVVALGGIGTFAARHHLIRGAP